MPMTCSKRASTPKIAGGGSFVMQFEGEESVGNRTCGTSPLHQDPGEVEVNISSGWNRRRQLPRRSCPLIIAEPHEVSDITNAQCRPKC
jgi:hypothetical protein